MLVKQEQSQTFRSSSLFDARVSRTPCGTHSISAHPVPAVSAIAPRRYFFAFEIEIDSANQLSIAREGVTHAE
jgi:hypothetical protein